MTKIAFLWPKSNLALQDWKYIIALLGSWLSPFPDPAAFGIRNLWQYEAAVCAGLSLARTEHQAKQVQGWYSVKSGGFWWQISWNNSRWFRLEEGLGRIELLQGIWSSVQRLCFSVKDVTNYFHWHCLQFPCSLTETDGRYDRSWFSQGSFSLLPVWYLPFSKQSGTREG